MFRQMLPTVRFVTLALVATATIAGVVPAAHAATNTATGDIGGVNADLDDSNTVNLTAQALALVKRAFLVDGTPLTDGAALPRGTVVKFMVYISNPTAFAVNDVSVQDVLAATFGYQTNSIKVDNSVAACVGACSGAQEATIFTAVNAAASLTDAVGGDVASYTAGTTTIDLGNQSVVGNSQLNIAANRVWAALFTVTMQ